MKWVLLVAGGGLGTVARYFFSGIIYQFAGARFPYGTLAVNLLGCFLVGFLAAVAEEKFLLSVNARIFLMVGVLGGFTTFSTFMLETANLIRDGETLAALGNVLASVIIGFFFFRLGVLLAEII